MNNISFFIIVYFVASLSIFQATFCMELSIDKKRQVYFNGCRDIDNNQEEKLQKFLEWASRTDFAFARKKIENKLQRLQDETIFEGKIFWANIQKKYQISDEVWDSRMDDARNMYNAEREKKWLKGDVKHDCRIPADILIMLKKYLCDYQMNGDELNLELHSAHVLFYGAVPNLKIEKDKKIITVIEPCRLMIPDSIRLYSQKAKEGMCCILVNFLSDEGSLNLYKLTAVMGLNNIYPDSYKINIPENDKEALSTVNSKLAEIMLALKSSHHAAIVKAFRKEFYDEEISCLEHYKVFSKIKRLYQTLSWLKRYGSEDKSF